MTVRRKLAYFAVMMKARQYDRRFSRGIQPHMYSIESNGTDRQ